MMRKIILGAVGIILIVAVALAASLSKYSLTLWHIHQQPNMCVPTSIAMVLGYYGYPNARPNFYESFAKENPNFSYTRWQDMVRGLKTIGYYWEIRVLSTDTLDYAAEIELIETEISEKRPPIVDLDFARSLVGPDRIGHTVPLVGFDNNTREFIFSDPARSHDYIRKIRFDEFQKCWHSSRDLGRRVIMLTRPRK